MAREHTAPWALLVPHLVALAVLVSCRAVVPAAGSPADAPATWSAPADWDTCSRERFELLLADLTPGPPDPGALDRLTEAAGDPDRNERALRAALLLATLDDPAADLRLLELLERREPRPTRPADAALVLAAARLGLAPADDDVTARLVALSLDETPHPDLEVRVECARSALLRGDESVGPFLLRVLRLGTPLGLERDGAWRSAITTTWSRHRAGEALAEHLDVDNPYHGDMPLADREDGALELEELWNERP